IEKVLKVLSLTSGDKHLCHVTGTMKGEMPHARIRAQAVEDCSARQWRIHDHQMRDILSVSLSIGIGDHQTDVVACYYNGLCDAEVLPQQAMYIVCHRALVITNVWTGGVSSAAIVRDNHTETCINKRRSHVPPFPPRLRETMKKYDSAISVAGRDVMQSHTRLYVGHAVSQHRSALSLQSDHSSVVCVIRHGALHQRCRKPVPCWQSDCGNCYRTWRNTLAST